MKKLILWVIFSFSIFAQKEIRIAFFPNITHGQALVGKNQKIFDKYLIGTKITLSNSWELKRNQIFMK